MEVVVLTVETTNKICLCDPGTNDPGLGNVFILFIRYVLSRSLTSFLSQTPSWKL